MPNLPIDIVNSILLYLPVKSLIRFKITCKSWCCFIDDPYFIKSHLHRSSADINRQKFLFFDIVEGKRCSDYSIEVLSISSEPKVVLLDKLNLPGFNSIFYLQVFSCSGLVFINQPEGKNIILWNPVIRKYKLIPKLQKKDCCHVWTIYGFTYDVVADDYKVLCVYDTWDTRYIVEVYSVKNQSWRTIHTIFSVNSDFRLLKNCNPVSLNGVIYFMAVKKKGESELVCFHLVDEKIIRTPMPCKCERRLSFDLRVFGDRVCFIGTVDKEILFWSLEKDEKSWNKMSSVISKPGLYPDDVIRVKENGDILCKIDGGRFIEYNARKNEYAKFEWKEFPSSLRIGPLYVESLASLKIPWD